MNKSSFFNQVIQALSFPFKDPAWFRKVLIGGVIMLTIYIIPFIPAILVSGYCKRIMKRVILEDGQPYLPEWDDFGNLLADGLKLWGAGFIFTLPLILLYLIGFAFLIVGQFALMSSMFNQVQNGSSVMPPQTSLIFAGGWMIFLLIMMISFFIGVAISIFSAPAMAHVAATDSFSAAFRVQEWWPILKKGIGSFLVVIATSVFLSWIVLFAVQILTFTIVLIFALPFLYLFVLFFLLLYQYTFYAMAYRDSLSKLSAASLLPVEREDIQL